MGLSASFEITEYRQGRFWGWSVAGIRATGHRLTPLGPNACRVAFELPWSWLIYTVVCEVALKRIADIVDESPAGER